MVAEGLCQVWCVEEAWTGTKAWCQAVDVVTNGAKALAKQMAAD